jgi:glycosyltransferase involved in cell wall biosynthesis
LNRVVVVTRTKDRSVLLSRALDSVLAQTFTDWMHVIVNDGGERAPVEELVAARRSRYGERVKVVHHETSRGMEAASNAGLKAADGELAVIHDDDDSWSPEFLQACVEWLDAHRESNVAGVITHSVRVDEDIEGDEIVRAQRSPYNATMPAVTLWRMAASNSFPPISFLFRRAILDEVGWFREDLPVLGDWDFHLRVLTRFEIGLIPRELANYHFRRDATSAYSNTVTGAVDRHHHFDALLRNELLRKDLAAGRFGLGVLVNLAKQLDELQRAVDRNSAFTYVKDKVYNLAKRAKLL